MLTLPAYMRRKKALLRQKADLEMQLGLARLRADTLEVMLKEHQARCREAHRA